MKLNEAIKYYGTNVSVICTDGNVVTGLFGSYQTFADEPEEPESISIYIDDYGIEIPIDEVKRIEPILL